MPAEQLKERCWVLDPAGGPPGDDHSHHIADTELAALAKFAESHPDDPIKVRQLPEPCWVVRCDGDCADLLEDDDEGWTIHCEIPADALNAAEMWDWMVAKDGRTFCVDDTPEDIEPDERALAGPIPGQRALIGEDVPNA